MKPKDLLKKYLAHRRKKKFKGASGQKDVTILSNCCLAGLMYNDMKMKFLSPTINLYFGHHSFIDYVNHLEQYIRIGELVDSGRIEDCNGAPIGLLKAPGLPDIEIHFLHYGSFQVAKSKWIERTKRINLSKVFLVLEARDNHEHALIDEYVNLPYPKIIFSDVKPDSERQIILPSCYAMRNKSITSFVGLLGKRCYDDFGFVSNIFNREW